MDVDFIEEQTSIFASNVVIYDSTLGLVLGAMSMEFWKYLKDKKFEYLNKEALGNIK